MILITLHIIVYMLNVFLHVQDLALCLHHVYMCNDSHHVQTALHHAAIHGRSEVVKYLLENTTAQVNAKDEVSQC